MDCISLVEQNINYMTDKLFGDKDPNLKLITKMNLLYDGTEETKDEITATLCKMKRNNEYEVDCILKEMTLTYDMCGNIVPVGDKPNNETPTRCFEVYELEKSKETLYNVEETIYKTEN